MLLTLLVISIGVVVSFILFILFIRVVLTYKQFYLTAAPRDRDQRRDFNENKREQEHKALNLLLLLLGALILTGGVAYFSLWYQQVTTSQTAVPELISYDSSDWKLASVNWEELPGKNATELDEIEQNLATNLAFFLGPNTVTVNPGIAKDSLTVSITSFVANAKQLKLVKKNFAGMIKDSHGIEDIKVFDFSFGYYDDDKRYGKESVVYFREDSKNDLIILE